MDSKGRCSGRGIRRYRTPVDSHATLVPARAGAMAAQASHTREFSTDRRFNALRTPRRGDLGRDSKAFLMSVPRAATFSVLPTDLLIRCWSGRWCFLNSVLN